jgi:hypothetical protein
MSKRDVSAVISAAGTLAHFVTELVREVHARDGSDEQIHRVMTSHELIMKVADVAVEPLEQTNFRTKAIDVEPFAGARIDDCVVEAVDLARRKGCTVRFVFNDLPVEVEPDSLASAVHKDWYRRNHALSASHR